MAKGQKPIKQPRQRLKQDPKQPERTSETHRMRLLRRRLTRNGRILPGQPLSFLPRWEVKNYLNEMGRA